jgi:hypothetical protein
LPRHFFFRFAAIAHRKHVNQKEHQQREEDAETREQVIKRVNLMGKRGGLLGENAKFLIHDLRALFIQTGTQCKRLSKNSPTDRNNPTDESSH